MTMAKVTEVIGIPADSAAFEAFDWADYWDRRRRLPGLERLEVARVAPSPDGSAPKAAIIGEGWFRDAEAVRETHASGQGAAVRESLAALRELATVEVHVSAIESAPSRISPRTQEAHA